MTNNQLSIALSKLAVLYAKHEDLPAPPMPQFSVFPKTAEEAIKGITVLHRLGAIGPQPLGSWVHWILDVEEGFCIRLVILAEPAQNSGVNWKDIQREVEL